MKKSTKAIYAGVVGLALLTSTGGTFALWTDTAALPAATAETGDLRLALTAERADREDPWDWVRITDDPQPGTEVPGFPTAVRPGDVLRGTTYLAATIEGSTLVATLAAEHEWPTEIHTWFEDATVEVIVDKDPRAASSANDNVELKITIEFPEDPPLGSDGNPVPVEEQVSLGDVVVTLQQVAHGQAFRMMEVGNE